MICRASRAIPVGTVDDSCRRSFVLLQLQRHGPFDAFLEFGGILRQRRCGVRPQFSDDHPEVAALGRVDLLPAAQLHGHFVLAFRQFRELIPQGILPPADPVEEAGEKSRVVTEHAAELGDDLASHGEHFGEAIEVGLIDFDDRHPA